MTSKPPLFEVKDLTANRGGFALSLPSLRLESKQVIAITGPSGCGKSTLLDLLGLVLRPNSANIFDLKGTPLLPLWQESYQDSLAQLRAQYLGYILQTGGLFPFLSVVDNIRLSLEISHKKDPDDLLGYLSDRLEIRPLWSLAPAALSIGERQRVAIARALIHRPAIILADEPTAALDPTAAQSVIELFLTLTQQLEMTALIVCHDWDLVSRYGLIRLKAEFSQDSHGPLTQFRMEESLC